MDILCPLCKQSAKKIEIFLKRLPEFIYLTGKSLPEGVDAAFAVGLKVEVKEVQVKHVVDSGTEGTAVELALSGGFDDKSSRFGVDPG